MLIIGLAGGTGSGKTTVVNDILEGFTEDDVTVLSQDNYYFDSSHLTMEERNEINFDHPHSIDFDLLTKHVRSLKQGKSIQQPVYSFKTHTRTGELNTVLSKDVIIIEGILVLTYKMLRKLFDIKIFVHADSDERLIRRIRRDIKERNRDLDEVLERYQKTLKPMHEQFIEPSKAYADIIIPNMKKKNDVAINMITNLISNKLKA